MVCLPDLINRSNYVTNRAFTSQRRESLPCRQTFICNRGHACDDLSARGQEYLFSFFHTAEIIGQVIAKFRYIHFDHGNLQM